MSDCVDDYYAVIGLIFDEYFQLKKLNPNCRLLGLLKNVNSQGFTKTEEFDNKYSHYGKSHKTETGKANAYFGAYFSDLNNEVTEELKKLLSKEKGKSEEELWKEMEKRKLDGLVRTHLTHNRQLLTDFVQ